MKEPKYTDMIQPKSDEFLVEEDNSVDGDTLEEENECLDE